MAYSPLDDLFGEPHFNGAVPVPPPSLSVGAHTLEVPERDRPLFEQLRADLNLSNLWDEIAYTKYLRVLLQRELELGTKEANAEIATKICKTITKTCPSLSIGDIYEDVLSHLPEQRMTLAMAKTMSKLLETSGKLAEQQKKIIEGTPVTVHVEGVHIVQALLTQCIKPCIPVENWEAIRERCRTFAPRLGEVVSIDLL